MARRKRKEESPEWTPPEFDEVAYMRTEMEGARAAVLVVLWALAGALVSYALFANNQAVTAFFVGLFFSVGLYWVLPMINIRTKDFKRKDWTGHGITYFFSWLAFWILLINVPFGDFTNPTVGDFSAAGYNISTIPVPGPGSVWCVAPSGATITVPLSGNNTLYVLFRATDNVGVVSLSVTVNSVPFSGTIERVTGPSACKGVGEYLPGTYALSIPAPSSGSFNVSITATDAVGRASGGAITVRVMS